MLVNKKNILGKRKVSYIHDGFVTVQIGLSDKKSIYYKPHQYAHWVQDADRIDMWIYSNLQEEFYSGINLFVEEDLLRFNWTWAFKEPVELTTFILICPFKTLLSE